MYQEERIFKRTQAWNIQCGDERVELYGNLSLNIGDTYLITEDP